MSSLAHATHEAQAPTGDPFGGTPYRLRRQLSSGSVGEVFVVEHRELGSEFVAKLLHERLLTDPQLVDRVRVEAQALGKLYHPNIVSVLGYGLTRDRRPYLVTEHLRGQTLGARLKLGALPPLDALVYACQILWALAAAHSIGIVHRDIKPENLFLVERPGAMPQLKVLDFSIARVLPGLSPEAPLPLVLPTDTGVIVGTPRYISPEAALGQHVDHRADIYGVGIVLYQMLTGHCPFDHAKGNTKMLVAHLTEEPKPPSWFANSPLVKEVDAVVLTALQKKPEHRFQSAKKFEVALTGITANWLSRDDISAVATRTHSPIQDTFGQHAHKSASADATEPFALRQASLNRLSVVAKQPRRLHPILLYTAVALAAAIGVALTSLLGSLLWR